MKSGRTTNPIYEIKCWVLLVSDIGISCTSMSILTNYWPDIWYWYIPFSYVFHMFPDQSYIRKKLTLLLKNEVSKRNVNIFTRISHRLTQQKFSRCPKYVQLCTIHGQGITASMLRSIKAISLWYCWGIIKAQVALLVAFSSFELFGRMFLIFLLTIPLRFSMDSLLYKVSCSSFVIKEV